MPGQEQMWGHPSQADLPDTGGSGSAPETEPSPVTENLVENEVPAPAQGESAPREVALESENQADHGADLRPLAEEMASLRELFERRASEYEKTIRDLHARVEELQRSQLMGLMKPVFVQFADLHAEMTATAQQARLAGIDGHASDLEYFAGAFERLLAHFDLESVGAAVGSPFDRRVHAAVLTKKTADQAADQTVARVVRQGFKLCGEERVLIPARVVVWKAVERPEAVPAPRAQQIDAPDSPASQNATDQTDGELS